MRCAVLIGLVASSCAAPPPQAEPPLAPAEVALPPVALEPPPDVIPEVTAGPGIPELSEPPAEERRRRDPPPPRENPRPFACGPNGLQCDARGSYCLHSGVIGGVAPPPGVDYRNNLTWSCQALPTGCGDCACILRAGGSMGSMGCDGEGWTGLSVENIGYAP